MYTAAEIDEYIVNYLRKVQPERHTAIKVVAKWFEFIQFKTGGTITAIHVAADRQSRDKFFVSYHLIPDQKNYDRTYDITNPRTYAEEQMVDPIKAYNRAMRGVI